MIAAVLPLFVWDFAESDGGLVSTGETGQWEYGVPSGATPTSDHVWGTRMSGLYLNDTVDELTVELPDLTGTEHPVLVFEHWYDILPGDLGTLETGDGAAFEGTVPSYGYPTVQGGYAGQSGGFVSDSVALSEGATALRFVFAADETLSSRGWYLASLALYDGDPVPPRIAVTSAPEDTQDLTGPYVIDLFVEDDQVAEPTVTVLVSIGGLDYVPMDATPDGVGAYSLKVPSQSPDTLVRWYATASDGENEAREPASGEHEFRVYLAAPTALRGPEEDRLVGASIPLTWDEPVTPHAVLGYEVYELGVEDPVATSTAPAATVPVTTTGAHTWTVAALYDPGPGDASEPLMLVVEQPSLTALEPDRAYAGDQVYVAVSGSSLYLSEWTSLDLGEGTEVLDLEVLDVGECVALVSVAQDASPGPRDLTVDGSHGQFVFAGAFEVEDGASRPRIVDVAPDRIVQGSEETLTITASQPFAGAVTVVLDEDLVLTDGPAVSADELRMTIAADGDAPPGPRTVLLDDGERLWTFDLDVAEYTVTVKKRCDASAGGGFALLPILFAWRFRRRR